jgi:hypothetical protein
VRLVTLSGLNAEDDYPTKRVGERRDSLKRGLADAAAAVLKLPIVVLAEEQSLYQIILVHAAM